MIVWQDFVLDDFFGPTLLTSDEIDFRNRKTDRAFVMDDKCDGVLQHTVNPNYQGTRRDEEPARMVGNMSGLKSTDERSPFRTEADGCDQSSVRTRGEG